MTKRTKRYFGPLYIARAPAGALGLWLALAPCQLQAQDKPPPAPPAQPAPPAKPGQPEQAQGQVGEADEASDSPRASMSEYVKLCRAGKYDDAAKFLEVPHDLKGEEPQLAERLKAVLDRKAWIDLDKISPLSTGNLDDGLPRNYEEIARFQQPDGIPEPVRLVKRDVEGGRWRFTTTTVANVDLWYSRLEDRWLHEHLPAWLLRSGPKELLLWQWLAMPVLLLSAWALGYGLSRGSGALLVAFTRHTAARWDDELVRRLKHPFTLSWTLAIVYFSLPWLGLYEPARVFLNGVLRGCFLLAVFWMLSAAIAVAGQAISLAPWARRIGASRTLIPLGTRVSHVVLFTLASVAMLSELGYPVASLIAGLGVGGLAVALAAQKTLENLFGAFAIGIDQPFREGDSVKIDDFSGEVESIGLRSTKIRTADRTVISIPNGKLADMRVESFARRDRLRFASTLSLAYGTTPAQLREVIAGVERSLRAQPKVYPDGLSARLLQITLSSVDIDVNAAFSTLDWSEFQRIREELLLSFMEIVEQAGASLALPMQGTQLERERLAENAEHSELRHE